MYSPHVYAGCVGVHNMLRTYRSDIKVHAVYVHATKGTTTDYGTWKDTGSETCRRVGTPSPQFSFSDVIKIMGV